MDEVRTSGMPSALAAFASARAFFFSVSKLIEPTQPIVPTWWSISRTAAFVEVNDCSDISSPQGCGRPDDWSTKYLVQPWACMRIPGLDRCPTGPGRVPTAAALAGQRVL